MAILAPLCRAEQNEDTSKMKTPIILGRFLSPCLGLNGAFEQQNEDTHNSWQIVDSFDLSPRLVPIS